MRFPFLFQFRSRVIHLLCFLLLVSQSALLAQNSWTTVTDGIPLSDDYRQLDGRFRISRLFQLGDRAVASVGIATGPDVLVSTTDGLNWDIFPEALDGNRFDVTQEILNRRSFNSLDPNSDLRLPLPFGRASRLEMTYRDTEGTFLMSVYLGDSAQIPSVGALKISEESSAILEVIKGEFIHFPDLPSGEVTNLGLIDDTLVIQTGSQLSSWCEDCRGDNLWGYWQTQSGSGGLRTKAQKMAGGTSVGFILEDPFVSSVSEVSKRYSRARQFIASASDETLNDIASHSDTVIAVGKGREFGASLVSGLIVTKLPSQDWQTILISDAEEFLHVSHGSEGWLATTKKGQIWSSPQGTEWSIVGSSSFEILELTEISGRWIAATDMGEVYSSDDLTNWNQQLGAYSATRGIATAGNYFLTLVTSNLRRSPFAAEGSPDIITQPLFQAILSGEPATLSVEAIGQNLTYQWYLGNNGDRANPIAGAHQGTYTSPALQLEQSYWVEVSNPLGWDESFTAEVVIQSQPTIERHPASATVDLSKWGGLNTSVMASGNGLSYQWYRGESGDLDQPLLGETERSIVLPATAPGTEVYFVRVSNRVGFVDSSSITFTVNPVLPTISTQPEDLEVAAGDSAFLDVGASGPILSYQWYRGESGDVSQPLVGAERSYFWPDTTSSERESYWVRVTNPAGLIDSATVQVLVSFELPVISTFNRDEALLAGTSYFLNCSVSNSAGVSYQWFEGISGDTTKPVAGATLITFEVPSEEVGSFPYWVQATNPAGETNSDTRWVTFVARSYEEWVSVHGLNNGNDAPDDSAAEDQFTNLFRYLAFLDPFDDSSSAFTDFQVYQDEETGESYLALWVRSRPYGNGAALHVEQSSDLVSGFVPAVDTGDQMNHDEQTISRLYRTSLPISATTRQFLRVRIRSVEE
ncbi:hypothetical protein V2O64_21065 [Verrucomicrobiaceae bacterium 227]